MKEKKWLCTAAGKVSSILSVLVVIMFAIVLFGVSNRTENILIGLTTNLIGIIITVSFVQYFFHKQDEEEEKKEERKKILRYNKLMEMLIDRYILFFQCTTTTITEREQFVDSKDLLRKFSFADMADMYKLSTVLSAELLRPSIELFYEAEHKLRECTIKMLNDIDFKYNKEIEDVLLDFVKQSTERDVSAVIISNQKTLSGNRPISEEVTINIQNDDKYKWVEEYEQGNLCGNMMTPYVVLYLLLQTEGQLITKYQLCIEKLKDQENKD